MAAFVEYGVRCLAAWRGCPMIDSSGCDCAALFLHPPAPPSTTHSPTHSPTYPPIHPPPTHPATHLPVCSPVPAHPPLEPLPPFPSIPVTFAHSCHTCPCTCTCSTHFTHSTYPFHATPLSSNSSVCSPAHYMKVNLLPLSLAHFYLSTSTPPFHPSTHSLTT